MVVCCKTNENTHINISLNYFTQKPVRQIIIDGEGLSIQADLIANSVKIYENNKYFEYNWPDIEKNTTYIAEHEALLTNDTSNICTFKEGLKTMFLINTIRTFKQHV